VAASPGILWLGDVLPAFSLAEEEEPALPGSRTDGGEGCEPENCGSAQLLPDPTLATVFPMEGQEMTVSRTQAGGGNAGAKFTKLSFS
jgi:hypothetical protein